MPFTTTRLSDLRKVQDMSESRQRRQLPIEPDEAGSDIYEVNEKTMFAMRMKKEEELLKTLTP